MADERQRGRRSPTGIRLGTSRTAIFTELRSPMFSTFLRSWLQMSRASPSMSEHCTDRMRDPVVCAKGGSRVDGKGLGPQALDPEWHGKPHCGGMAPALPRSLPTFSPEVRERIRCRVRQRVELLVAQRRSRGHSSRTGHRFLPPAGRLPARFLQVARQNCCAIPEGGTNPMTGWNPPGRARRPLIRPPELRAPLRAQIECLGCFVPNRLSPR